MRTFITFLLLLTLYSCSSPKGKIYKKEDFVGTWPFRIDRVDVYCTGSNKVFLDAEGKTYALNGKAISDKSASDLDEIRLENPNVPGTLLLIPSEFINDALTNCK